MTRAEKIQSLTSEAAQVQAFLASPPPTDDGYELTQRLATCNVYIASTGRMLADAKALLDEALVESYEKYGEKTAKLGAQMGGKVLQAYCKDESFLVTWIERENRALVHQGDNLRTLISFAKESMRMSFYADNIRPDAEVRREYEGW